MWERLTEPWEKVEIEVAEVIEARDDLVVTSNRARFVGRDGIELPGPTRSGWVWQFRDGQIVHLAFYNSLGDALEAAGLSEEAMSQENVEIVRRYVEQYGDLAPKDMLRWAGEFWEPDGDYYPVRKFPEARPCHGIEEFARFQAEYQDAWDRYEISGQRDDRRRR